MRPHLLGDLELLENRGLMSTTSGLATSLSVGRPLSVIGQAVVITFTETNVGKTNLNVTNSPSLDGLVVTQGGKTVWKSNAGPVAQNITIETLKPGQSTSFSRTWDGRSNLVNPTNPGVEGPALAGTFAVHRESSPDQSSKFVIARALITPPRPSAPPLATGLTTSITTDKASYTTGQETTITLTETNTTSHDINVSDGPSIDGFVARQNGQTVWQSNGGIQPFFIALEVLHPGQSHTLTATWDGRGIDGFTGVETAPLHGQFTLSNELFPGQTVTIERTV